jgi:arabinose-5-phosphate isomerase
MLKGNQEIKAREIVGSYPIQSRDISVMVIEQAREVLKIEAQSILDLVDRIGPEFEKAVDMILETKGRVILTGMGKSGLIARKIVATFNSTGTPSLFLHPAEAAHGDLGMVTRNNIVLAISHSGRTTEINSLLPMLKDMGAKIISLTGGLDSPMAEASDVVIDVGVAREACPMGMVPTASTTAALVMGDAIAVALINRRRFRSEDFRRFHPGGSLGERLSVKIREVMLTADRVPIVHLDCLAGEAIDEINAKGIGATLVSEKDGRLAGIITDGDLRRALTKNRDIHDMGVKTIMTSSPMTIDENRTAAEALKTMEFSAITHLVIVDARNRVKGLVHLHDLLGRKDFRVNGSAERT